MATPTQTRSNKALAWRKEYYFDRHEAQRVVRFCVERCRHSKGELAGRPFVPETWQYKILRRLFGWKRREDGTRKFRTLFLFVPRKNGKTTFGAVIALYLLHADREMGAEIVSAAADTDQANILFSIAKDMNDSDPVLVTRAKSFRRSLVVHPTGCSYKVISAEAHTKHGANLHGILFDELHAQPNRELYDVLKTSTGGRRQPLEIYMTTAGYDRNSVCWEVYDYACKVRDGDIEDPSFLSVIYGAKPNDDWTEEATWRKANPNFDVSIYKEYFRKEVAEAKAKPTYENTFKRLHLNIWTESDVRAVNMIKWRECGALPVDLEALAGKPCWLGLDLSSVNDLTALAAIFRVDDKWIPIMRFWCPADTLKERPVTQRHMWEMWVREGYINATPGGRIDYSRIRTEINALYNVYNVREIAVDPWNAHQLSEQLEADDGFTVVHVRQGMYTLSAPTKEFLSAVSEAQFAHGGDPVLTWCAGNLSTEEDAAGNLKPSKKRSPEKIDGCVAVITALSRALVSSTRTSVYDDRGVMVL
jgi:phage terminase large subunit-like protein